MGSDPNVTVRHYRQHLRFARYLTIRCTVLESEDAHQQRPIAGITRCVNAGGLEVLLPEPLSVKTQILVQIFDGDSLRGQIVSVGKAIATVLGPRFPHGVAFEETVEPSLVRQWVAQPKRRAHRRAEIQFSVEYTHAGTTVRGTCLNLCQGGMFIATKRALPPDSQLFLRFTLPNPLHPVAVQGRVAWVSGDVKDPGVIVGIGVQFLNLDPSAAAAISTLVDRLSAEAVNAGSA
jgi:uncharacterized protein (TIGR02266 family)